MDHRVLPSRPTLVFLLLTAIGVARIVATYRAVAQTSDETPNIGCGMQYLDLGRYDYGAFHPPLARIAIAVGPYLYGARSQKMPDRWREGNAVLNSAPLVRTSSYYGYLPTKGYDVPAERASANGGRRKGTRRRHRTKT